MYVIIYRPKAGRPWQSHTKLYPTRAAAMAVAVNDTKFHLYRIAWVEVD